MPSHIIWLDFGNENVPDRTCLKGVTLLCKTLCFAEWFKLFACFWFWQIKITVSVYSCLALQDTTSLLMEFTMFNRLCKDSEVTYNKVYNSQKELFITIFKEYTLFNNSAFEALEFSQSQLNQWYVTNWYNLAAFIKDSEDPLPSTSHSHSCIAQKYTQIKIWVVNALTDAAATLIHYEVC